MRIIIDAQACQSEISSATNQHLLLAQSIASTAGSHQVFIALNSQFSDTIIPLRQAFSALVSPEKFIVFDALSSSSRMQETSAGQWCSHAAELIRDGFFATLNPDFVISYYVLEDGLSHHISSIAPTFDSYFIAIIVDESILAQLSNRDETFYRLQKILSRASLIITTTTEVYDHLCSAIEVGVTQKVKNCADAAAIWDAMEEVLSTRENKNTEQQRPRLAYVSPLPPEKSGIADYSAELLPELARYYEIDLIIDQALVTGSWINASLPLRTVEWFEAHADDYDRIIYQIGNSPLHKHMFALLERHPGIVVLHDFFLSHTFDYLDHTGYCSGSFVDALYYSHGVSALVAKKKNGENDAIWTYPCNKKVIDQAAGVIVHSQFSRQLADDWYGDNKSEHWRTIPLIRGHLSGNENRLEARKQLQLADTNFIVCSFGMMGQTKSNIALIDAWLASPLANDPHCQLIFVGENEGGIYGRQIREKIASNPAGARITITGFVSHDVYCRYLVAADAAVQLRIQTRGETSASVLDCLLHGLPTIVNAHGAIAELPDDVLYQLDDEFSSEALTHALSVLWQDPALRSRLSAAASHYIQKNHTPKSVGKLYYEAIEHFTRTSAQSHYKKLVREIKRLDAPHASDLMHAAKAIAANQPATGPRQLLIDISALVQSDLKTGIQRVVRSILTALIKTPPNGFRIEPVYSQGGGATYRYASSYLQDWLGCVIPHSDDAPIELHAGDIFLGLDLFLSGIQQNKSLLQDYKNRGVAIYFVVFDILPVLRPDVFPEGTEADFSGWLTTVTTIADGLVCISAAVADELTQWSARHPVQRPDPIHIGHFHLGADIAASVPSLGLPADAQQILNLIQARPSMLMVGTLEPRKGHAQALAALTLLWADDVAVNLVIVGKQGWMVDELVAQLRQHPENGKRLFWLEGASDEMLLMLYEGAAGLLAPSEGEGFGLPLIEAAQHGLPILARKLPVFQEVMGEHAYYFEGLTADALATATRTWLALHLEGKAPHSGKMSWLTWDESASQLLKVILKLA